MNGSIVRILKPFAFAFALSFLAISTAMAGGFGIQVELPAGSDLKLKDALLTASPAGCHGLGATLTARAEGIVNGQRKTVVIDPILVSRKQMGELYFDTFAIQRQWPTEGSWVVVITATTPEKWATHAIVEIGADGQVRTAPRRDNKNAKEVVVERLYGPLKNQVEVALKQAVKHASARTTASNRSPR